MENLARLLNQSRTPKNNMEPQEVFFPYWFLYTFHTVLENGIYMNSGPNDTANASGMSLSILLLFPVWVGPRPCIQGHNTLLSVREDRPMV